MILRDYQQNLEAQLYHAWDDGCRNVCMQLMTGGGKTAIFTKVVKDWAAPSIVIAHRMQILDQISLSLARAGVYHNIIGSRQMRKSIISLHLAALKRSYYNQHALCTVASVDTLATLKRESWMSRVTLVIQDEAHHVLRDNKWGRAAAMFPSACGLYPTATPLRADGYGLGSHADGIMDALVVGPSMRELISRGFLTDYKIFAPPSNLDLSPVTISANGDYSPSKLRHAVHESRITGDVVEHYLRIARGKLGITFAVDVVAANEIAMAFRNAGVPAESISAKTHPVLRFKIMEKFRNREILQLVNVDLLGEGVDVPAIEVISMARPSQSYAVVAQHRGRVLRPAPGKKTALIIDHVGNTYRHGLPDREIPWTLDRRERRSRGGENIIPVTTCLEKTCLAVYERYLKKCPYCGNAPIITDRSRPDCVDGDLLELSPEALNSIKNEVERIDGAARVPQNLDPIAQLAVTKHHRARQQNQVELRESIARWAGVKKTAGYSDDQIYKLFYFNFNVDVLTAQTLNSKDAIALRDKIEVMLA